MRKKTESRKDVKLCSVIPLYLGYLLTVSFKDTQQFTYWVCSSSLHNFWKKNTPCGVHEERKVAGIYLYSPITTCHLPLAKVYPTGNGVHCTELYHMTFGGHSWLWFIFKSKSNEGSSAWIELDTWGPKIQLWETQNEGHSQVASLSQFQCPCLRNLFMVPVCQKKYLTIHIIAQLGQTVSIYVLIA